MMKSVVIVILILIAALACQAENNALNLTPEQLALRKNKLVGVSVVVDGCIYVHRHGMQIGPCQKHDWRQITPVIDPDDKLPAAFRALGRPPFGSFKARFSGHILSKGYEWPKPGVHSALSLDSITNVQSTGP